MQGGEGTGFETRVMRFQQQFLKDEVARDDNEENNAKKMFLEDIT